MARFSTIFLIYLLLGILMEGFALSLDPPVEHVIEKKSIFLYPTALQTSQIHDKEIPETTVRSPLVVYIIYENMLKCAGTIIHPRWIMSAGHCALFYTPKTYKTNPNIIAGIHDFKFGNTWGLGVQISVEDWYRHPNFSYISHVRSEDHREYYFNDVGLFRTETEIPYGDNIQPVKLPKEIAWEDYGGQHSKVLGFGTKISWHFRNDVVLSLRETNVNLIGESTCKKILKFVDGICGITTDTEGLCLRDSGGPMLIGDVQVGIVSLVSDNCAWRRPDVFTRVTSVLPWIKAKLDGYNDHL